MLRIGLTGGIGAGKSTVSEAFRDLGGVIVDGDVIAREVVAQGTEGLKSLVETFGDDVLLADGSLDRPALAAKAFVDDEQRAKLNAIVHPLVGKRRMEIIESVPSDAVVVEDIPLLVETGMAPMFPFVVVVTTPVETRVARLIQRGMDEADARNRIAAQAPEEQRRAIADVLLDNSGSQDTLVEAARALWRERVLPLAHNITARQCVQYPSKLVPYNPGWPEDAGRIIRRIQMACGAKVLRVDHIGPTAVEGMDADDVIDVQVTVADLDGADEIGTALAGVGYPRSRDVDADSPHTDDPAMWRKRLHCAADPGRPANIHLRVNAWPNQQFALLFTDWLRANPEVREDYSEADAYRRAREWADATGWQAG